MMKRRLKRLQQPPAISPESHYHSPLQGRHSSFVRGYHAIIAYALHMKRPSSRPGLPEHLTACFQLNFHITLPDRCVNFAPVPGVFHFSPIPTVFCSSSPPGISTRILRISALSKRSALIFRVLRLRFGFEKKSLSGKAAVPNRTRPFQKDSNCRKHTIRPEKAAQTPFSLYSETPG